MSDNNSADEEDGPLRTLKANHNKERKELRGKNDLN
jgi:hypothetical protein